VGFCNPNEKKKKTRLKGTKVCLGKNGPSHHIMKKKNLKSPYLENNLQHDSLTYVKTLITSAACFFFFIMMRIWISKFSQCHNASFIGHMRF